MLIFQRCTLTSLTPASVNSASLGPVDVGLCTKVGTEMVAVVGVSVARCETPDELSVGEW